MTRDDRMTALLHLAEDRHVIGGDALDMRRLALVPYVTRGELLGELDEAGYWLDRAGEFEGCADAGDVARVRGEWVDPARWVTDKERGVQDAVGNAHAAAARLIALDDARGAGRCGVSGQAVSVRRLLNAAYRQRASSVVDVMPRVLALALAAFELHRQAAVRIAPYVAAHATPRPQDVAEFEAFQTLSARLMARYDARKTRVTS